MLIYILNIILLKNIFDDFYFDIYFDIYDDDFMVLIVNILCI